jgi:hypothetical protein
MIADEIRARDWWNSLTVEERLTVVEEAGLLKRLINQRQYWTQPWDQLLPFSQQKALLRYYAGKFAQ